MRLFALSNEREVIVSEDSVFDESGRELTGLELDVLASQLDQARLHTKWRELHTSIPLGAVVVATRDAFEGKGRVVAFRRARPRATDHEVEVALSGGRTLRLTPSAVSVVPEPRGAA